MLKFNEASSEIHIIDLAQTVWISYHCWSEKSVHIFQPLLVCYSTTPTWHKK